MLVQSQCSTFPGREPPCRGEGRSGSGLASSGAAGLSPTRARCAGGRTPALLFLGLNFLLVSKRQSWNSPGSGGGSGVFLSAEGSCGSAGSPWPVNNPGAQTQEGGEHRQRLLTARSIRSQPGARAQPGSRSGGRRGPSENTKTSHTGKTRMRTASAESLSTPAAHLHLLLFALFLLEHMRWDLGKTGRFPFSFCSGFINSYSGLSNHLDFKYLQLKKEI